MDQPRLSESNPQRRVFELGFYLHLEHDQWLEHSSKMQKKTGNKRGGHENQKDDYKSLMFNSTQPRIKKENTTSEKNRIKHTLVNYKNN